MSIGRSFSAVLFVLLTWLFVGIHHAYGDSQFDWEQGLRVQWDDADLRVGALLHADRVDFDEDLTELEDSTDFRRARITSRLDFRDLRLRADYDFGISEGWKSLFAEYRGIERLRLVGGNHTAPFSLEDNMSSSNLPFMERSSASALAPGLLTGVSVRHWGEDWMLAGGLFGDEINDLARRQADGQGFVGRATWTPLRKDDSVVHLGIALENREIDSGEAVRLRARPFSRLADERLVDTRSIRDADRIVTEGYELAWAERNRRLQAEWYRSRVAVPGRDPGFSGFYIAGSMTLGARAYRYSRSRGVFGRVEPEGDDAAYEIGLRYSTLDLSDAEVEGGKQEEYTLALSWIHGRQLRLMTNYSRIEARPNRDGDDETVDVIGLRLLARL